MGAYSASLRTRQAQLLMKVYFVAFYHIKLKQRRLSVIKNFFL